MREPTHALARHQTSVALSPSLVLYFHCPLKIAALWLVTACSVLDAPPAHATYAFLDGCWGYHADRHLDFDLRYVNFLRELFGGNHWIGQTIEATTSGRMQIHFSARALFRYQFTQGSIEQVMGGIINYIHGECGVVESLTIQSDDDGRKYRVLRMRNNPFRSDAIDYGSDIRIDPTLTPGNEVSFVRLDPRCGYWLRKSERYHPSLKHALSRYLSPDEQPSVAMLKRADTAPLVEASVFLSHVSWNKLFARFVRSDLERYGRVSVWLDEEQGRTRDAESNLDQWLQTAITHAKGIVILWNEPCRESDWVRKEVEWAVQRSDQVPVVVVNCDGAPLPADLQSISHVVNAEGMWYFHGLGEEVFPYLHRLETRTQWIGQNKRFGTHIEADPVESCMSFEDISPHEGTAESAVRWSLREGIVTWEFDLRDRRTNEVATVSGPMEIRTGRRQARRVSSASHQESMSRYPFYAPHPLCKCQQRASLRLGASTSTVVSWIVLMLYRMGMGYQ